MFPGVVAGTFNITNYYPFRSNPSPIQEYYSATVLDQVFQHLRQWTQSFFESSPCF